MLYCGIALDLVIRSGKNDIFCSVVIGFASMVPVILYPLAKRYTNYPQIVLGMTFNIGAVMGYTAVTGQMDLALQTALYGSCIIWTIYYDTIYAFQVSTLVGVAPLLFCARYQRGFFNQL